MKDKVIAFIIGLLVGAVIASGCFLIYTKVSNNNDNSNTAEVSNQGGQAPEMNQSGNSQSTPPEKPDGDTGSEPPEMPSENSSNANTNTNN